MTAVPIARRIGSARVDRPDAPLDRAARSGSGRRSSSATATRSGSAPWPGSRSSLATIPGRSAPSEGARHARHRVELRHVRPPCRGLLDVEGDPPAGGRSRRRSARLQGRRDRPEGEGSRPGRTSRRPGKRAVRPAHDRRYPDPWPGFKRVEKPLGFRLVFSRSSPYGSAVESNPETCQGSPLMPVSILTSLMLWSSLLAPASRIEPVQTVESSDPRRSPRFRSASIWSWPVSEPRSWALPDADTEEEETGDGDPEWLDSGAEWTSSRITSEGRVSPILRDRATVWHSTRSPILRC